MWIMSIQRKGKVLAWNHFLRIFQAISSVSKDGLGMFHTEVVITFVYDALKLPTKPFSFLLAF